jgi:hypothetical protein
MKEKHGQYIALQWEDEPDAEYIKGHITIEEAREALNRWADEFGDGITAVEHKWARWIPVTGCYYDMELTMVDGPASGAFAITEATFAPLSSRKEQP